VPFEIVTDESAAALAPGSAAAQPGTALMPAQALRVFHPPYGRDRGAAVSSTGIRGPSRCPTSTCRSTAIHLGHARLVQAREDERVVVRLDAGTSLSILRSPVGGTAPWDGRWAAPGRLPRRRRRRTRDGRTEAFGISSRSA